MADDYDLMKKILRLKRKGKAIDLGCGYGDDAIFLAKHGLEVTCVDNSDSAIYETKNSAAIHNVFIRIFKKDLRDFSLDEKFDVALCSGVMHFLSKDECFRLIEYMKKIAGLNGLNVIDGLLIKNYVKEKNLGYFKKNELLKSYKNWEIVEYKEISDPNLTSRHTKFLLIARKSAR
ncbi:MAG: methyltransferase domain-containing protein [Nanoarchaeota archaeon]|nr:methyltransferase domain-containing protein [Nanoarchaeota archaeon]